SRIDAETLLTPRNPRMPGQAHLQVLSYTDVLRNRKPVGARVIIIGAGGIGFDIAEYLAPGAGIGHASPTLHPDEWRREWGLADPTEHPGDVVLAQPSSSARQITL